MSEEDEGAGLLMETLISKMESMDGQLQMLKSENTVMKQILMDPAALSRKAGFVSAATPFAEGMIVDAFRGDSDDDSVMKGEGLSVPDNNEEFHAMSWDDIHAMADDAKSLGLTDQSVPSIAGLDA